MPNGREVRDLGIVRDKGAGAVDWLEKAIKSDFLAGPEYLRVTWPTYLLGAAYERVVNTFDFLAIFRILLIAQLRKPASDVPGIQS